MKEKPFWEIDYNVLRKIDERYKEVGYPIEGLIEYLMNDLPEFSEEEIRSSVKRLTRADLIFPAMDTNEWGLTKKGKKLMRFLKETYIDGDE